MNVQERVANGAALLDRVEPDWWKKLKGKKIDIDDCDKCILGHVYGAYVKGYINLCRKDSSFHYGAEWGFVSIDSSESKKLATEWRKAIKQRSNNATVNLPKTPRKKTS